MAVSNVEIKDLVQKWKGKEGNTIMVLHEIQNKYGYVPRDVALEVSKLLEIPLARIYEVITFYNYFELSPPAKHTVSVCLGTACYMKGSPRLIDELKNILHVHEGESTSDGNFHLNVVRCLGCCGLSPVMSIDGKIYGKVAKQELVEIISRYVHEGENAKV
jgi:NADH-quinone oxidoreductase subunit E